MCTYKLDAPMNWEQFKAMPTDLQVKYIENLRELYGVTDRMLGNMFGVSNVAVFNYRAKIGVGAYMDRRLTDEERARRDAMWSAFCNGVVGGAPEKRENSHESVVEKCEDPEVEEIIEGFKEWSESIEPEPDTLVVEDVITPLDLSELSAVFTGEFEPTRFLQFVAGLPIPKSNVRIKVEVTKV